MCVYVKFYFKLKKNSSETFELLQCAIIDDALSWTCFEWFKWFKEGKTFVKDNKHPGNKPSTSKANENVVSVCEITSINYWINAEDGGKLHENVRKKKPESWKNGFWMLHHDNSYSPQLLAYSSVFRSKLSFKLQ